MLGTVCTRDSPINKLPLLAYKGLLKQTLSRVRFGAQAAVGREGA